MISKIAVVSPINTPQKPQKNVTGDISSQTYFAQQEQKPVTFSGLGSLLAGIFRPSPNDLILEKLEHNTALDKNRNSIIRSLLSRKEGLYILETGDSIFIESDGCQEDISNTKEIIMKASPESYIRITKDDKIEKSEVRLGLLPEQISNALYNNVERLTVISDVGIQIMKFPKNPNKRKEYCDQLLQKEMECSAFVDNLNNEMPEKKDKILFDYIKNLIKDMPEISLELIPFARVHK